MIRDFSIFYKLSKLNHSGLQLYERAAADFSTADCPCPFCGARNPTWKQHDTYDRYLIDCHHGQICEHTIIIIRLICSSCNHTHAVLPECLIPHSSYSLIFVLRVLSTYYLNALTVVELCTYFHISHATLYAWKTGFLIHKKLWLGILEDAAIDPTRFFNTLFTSGPSSSRLARLSDFFNLFGYSFLQGYRKTARFNSS